MLKSFFSIGASATDFSRYLISKEVEFVKNYCGHYTVVYLDLKDCKGDTWEEMYQDIWLCVREMVHRHKNELVDQLEKLDPSEIDFSKRTPPLYFGHMLEWLTTSLFQHHNKEVIILIDEYDTPLNSAFLSKNKFYDKASEFFRLFYSSAFKENPALKKACLIGIVELHSDGILTELNNARVYSVADNKYSSSFGFSKSEIESIFGNETEMSKFYEWYNGYTIGNNLVINPWSFMISFCDNEFKSYWVDSANSDSLTLFLAPHVKRIIPPIFAIMFQKNKKYEISPLKTQVNYSNIDWDTNSILHFLVHTGYLTYNLHQNKAFVSIPNHELSLHWKEEITELLKIAFGSKFQSRLKHAFQNFNTIEIELLFNEIYLFWTNYDVSKQNENPYPIFLFRCLFTNLHNESNVIVSMKKVARHGPFIIKIEYRDLKQLVVIQFKDSQFDGTGSVEADGNNYVTKKLGFESLLIEGSLNNNAMSSLKFQVIEN